MCVTKLSYLTPTKVLLKTCGWLSVRKLMAYHSLVLMHKTLVHQPPNYLYDKVTADGQFKYKTRQASECPKEFSFSVQHPLDNGTIRQDSSTKLGISKKGWCWKSVELYNTLPTSIRQENKLSKYKTRLKTWVQDIISLWCEELFILNLILQLEQKSTVTCLLLHLMLKVNKKKLN